MNTKTDSQPSDSAEAQQGDGGDCVSRIVRRLWHFGWILYHYAIARNHEHEGRFRIMKNHENKLEHHCAEIEKTFNGAKSCEGCDKIATKSSADGYPLCAECFADLNSPPNAESIHGHEMEAVRPGKHQCNHCEKADGYCENCPNPIECYQLGRCWPVVDYVPDAGKLCAEMDEAHALASESKREAAGTADKKPDGQAENAESTHPKTN